MIREVIQYIKKNPILIVILLLGYIVNLSLVLPINFQLGHDTIWHLALVNVAFKTFPPQIPIFAGETLRGYNYLLDFFMYLFTLVGINGIIVYSIVIPLLFLGSMTVFSIYLAKKFQNSIYFVASFVFFTFMATPFSYILSYFKRGSIFHGFSFPTTMQSSSALSNMSHAFTLPLIFYSLIILLKKKLTTRDIVLLSVMLSVAVGVKFYGGVILTFIIAFNLFLRFLKDKKFWEYVKYAFILCIPALLTVIFFYDPFSSVETGSIFAFYPLATIHPFIEDPDNLYIQPLVLARYTLEEAGGFSPRLIAIELFTIALYVLYNAGTRFVGFFTIFKRILKKQITQFEITLLATILFSACMSIFFIQKGGDWWNTVQFFGYTLILLNFFTALFIHEISKSATIIKFSLISIIVILTLPLNIELVMKSVKNINTPLQISNNELEALDYLKHKEYGVIFSVPVRYNSSHVAAFTSKPEYYANENILSNIGVDYEPRKKIVSNLEELEIEQLPVDYILLDRLGPDFDLMTDKISKVKEFSIDFENEEIIIYQKKK